MNNNLQNDIEKLERENKIFRRLLALSYSGAGNLYHDDGELQDSSSVPLIDFRRDSAEEIEDKIQQRGLNCLKEELSRNPNFWEDLKKPKIQP
jgi:hypothetical protein